MTRTCSKTIASQYGKEGERAKYFDFPSAVYSMYPQDKVLSKDGKQVGVSTWVGYSSNERKQLTLAYLEPEFAKPGTAVTFVWGEEGGGSKKPPSRATSRCRSAPSSARCPTWRRCGRIMRKAAGARRASCKPHVVYGCSKRRASLTRRPFFLR